MLSARIFSTIFLSIFLFFFVVIQQAVAANWIPDADKTNFPGELGDAVYRNLAAVAGHAGLVYRFDESTDTIMVLQASGYGILSGLVPWSSFLGGEEFWGARTHPTGVDFDQRLAIIDTAQSYLLGITYAAENPWNPYVPLVPYQHKGELWKLTTLRCDGLVELAYESVDKDPTYFPPVGPQNQFNELDPAVWENPVISNLDLSGDEWRVSAQDLHSGIDKVVAFVEQRPGPDDAWEPVSSGDQLESGYDAGWIPFRWQAPFNTNGDHFSYVPAFIQPGYDYRITLRAYDRVHHRTQIGPSMIAINGGGPISPFTDVELNLACAPGAHGCSFMRFSNDKITWSAAEPFADHKSWELLPGGGPRTVFVQFSQFSDIWVKSGTYSDTIYLADITIDSGNLTIINDDADPATIKGAPFRTAINNNIAEFYISGDLHIDADEVVVGIGPYPVQLYVGNNTAIAPGALFQFSSGNGLQGPGSGQGGSGGNGSAGGVGSVGNSWRPWGGDGGAGGLGGWCYSAGSAGTRGSSSEGYSGSGGTASLPSAAGTPGTYGKNSPEVCLGGSPQAGVAGGSGGSGGGTAWWGDAGDGGSAYGHNGGNGDHGTAGGPGGNGSNGLNGYHGGGGLNSAPGTILSAGSGGCGGSGGSGGGGGGGGGAGSGGGGGGGGGGSQCEDGGAGGNGGKGASSPGGGNGGQGGIGGAGGDGGGGFGITAYGKLSLSGTFQAKGEDGRAGESRHNGFNGEIGTNGLPGANGVGKTNGGDGGAGGQGGSSWGGGTGGAGGAGGTGGGGAGGSIALIASVIDNILAASVDTGGGLGGTPIVNDGEDGRFIFGDNVSTIYSGTVTGTNMVAANGPARTNPFISGSPQTPLLPDLAGGADAYGILSALAAADFPAVVAGSTSKMVGALVRLDVGPAGYSHDFSGHDLVFFVNLIDQPLAEVRFGVGSTSLFQELLAGGFANDPDFGGAGPAGLPQIGAHQVYATLVPHGLNSAGISLKYNGRTISANAADFRNNAILYVNANQSPQTAGSNITTNEDQIFTGQLTGSDPDGDSLTYTIVAQGSKGVVSIPDPSSPDFSYTPGAHRNGADSFTFKVNDGTVDSSTAVVTVTINPVNDAPSFAKGSDQTVIEDAGSRSIPGWATGLSAGPADELGQGLSFTVSNDNNALFSVQPAVSAGGTLTFAPAADANGAALVTVAAVDSGGTANGGVDTSAAQNFTITVTGVNDAPSFSSGTTLASIDEDTLSPPGAPISTLLAAKFSDPDSDGFAGIAISADTSAGTEGEWQYSTDGLTWHNIGPVSTSSALLLAATTKLRFVPLADYNGTPGSLMAYAVDDSSATSFTSGALAQWFNTTADDGTSRVSATGVSIGTSITGQDDVPVISAGQNFTVHEDAALSTPAGTVQATDADAGTTFSNWSIIGGNTNNDFAINPATGQITVSGALSFVTTPSYTLSITVSDGASTSAAADVTISITDVNDSIPVITAGQSFTVNEDAADATTVGTVQATDIDGGTTFTNWQISSGNNDAIFAIDSASGVISVADNTNLDFEVTAGYILAITVSDGINTSAAGNVIINVGNINDNTPVITAGQSFTLNENAANASTVGMVLATDADAATAFSGWAITGGNIGAVFAIDSLTGEIWVTNNSSLDFETTAFYTLTITVSDGTNTSAAENVVISISDFNDNTPVVTFGQSFTINENAANASTVGMVLATDGDAATTFSNWAITGGNTGAVFAIDSATGMITVADNTHLDFETTTGYTLSITVSDGANTSAAGNVTINISDINDSIPVITAGQSLTVNEDAAIASTVGTVLATDDDAGTTFGSWAIAGGNDDAVFAINALTGEITIADNANLDFETTAGYTLSITVSDGANTSAAENVIISIGDLNDETPVVTSGQSFTVNENAANSSTVGTALATDGDAGTMFSSWAITGGNTGAVFAINALTGEITVADNTNLDFETTADYILTITVSDGANTSAAESVTINVSDMNDLTPLITAGQSFTVNEDAANATPVGTVLATDGDASTTFGDWAIVSGNSGLVFAINALTGEITIADNTNLDFETTASYTLWITVSDGTNTSAAKDVAINIGNSNDTPPVINAGQSFMVHENAPNNSRVGNVLAGDSDGSATFSNWSIIGGNTGAVFAIASDTGEIRVADNTKLDFETTAVYTLSLTVSDGINTSAATDLIINVNNLNDNIPVVAAGQIFSVPENATNSTIIGTVLATDSDGDTEFSNWTIAGGNLGTVFAIDPISGDIEVIDNTNLDFETTDLYTLAITVSDGHNISDTRNVIINVLDVNEAPVFTGTPEIKGIAQVGKILSLINTGVSDADGDAVTLSYQWSADDVEIADATSASFTLTAEEKDKTVVCTIIADDSRGGTAEFTTAGVVVQDKFPWLLFLPRIGNAPAKNQGL